MASQAWSAAKSENTCIFLSSSCWVPWQQHDNMRKHEYFVRTNCCHLIKEESQLFGLLHVETWTYAFQKKGPTTAFPIIPHVKKLEVIDKVNKHEKHKTKLFFLLVTPATDPSHADNISLHY